MPSAGMTGAHGYEVAKEKKKKKAPEPSPWKVYRAGDSLSHVAFARIGYWDSWEQAWVVEGRVRSPSGRLRKPWIDVARLSRHGDLSLPGKPGVPPYIAQGSFLDHISQDMVRETEDYVRRSKEWLDEGGTLRDLNLIMAKENGTWEGEP